MGYTEKLSETVNSTISDTFTNLIYTAINPPCLSEIDSPYEPISIISEKKDLIEGIPDGIMALICPIIVYWCYSSFFHIVDVYQLAEKYRIHPSEEVLRRNTVTLAIVIRDVLIQHIIQTIFGYILYCYDPVPTTGFENKSMWEIKQRFPSLPSVFIYYIYWYGLSLLKIGIAFMIIDTWQYSLHRLMHVNKYLYRRFHSRHHKLYVPYAFGALFNDPVEGCLLDTVGTGIAAIITGLSPREALALYTFSTMKTVDDHCGYSLPFDLFQIVFPNNSIYHDIHHQHFGIKSNFSQPFFTIWDTMLNTRFHGVDAYVEESKKITLDKYKLFLSERRNKRVITEKKNHEPIKIDSDSDDEPIENKEKIN